MVKQFFKKKSSRQSTKHRAKIEKKIRAHKKKVKRETRKNSKKVRRKDPGVPNSYPFKEAILKQAEERKQQIEEERQKAKDRRKQNREKLLAKKRNLESSVKVKNVKVKNVKVKNVKVKNVKTKSKNKAEEKKKANKEKLQGRGKKEVKKTPIETSRKACFKEFIKVVNAADILLEVLDARDPLAGRCAELEQTVLSSGTNKRLVLVLNKIDLVPKENVAAWLKHLRNEFPAVAFRASTSTQNGEQHRMSKNEKMMQSSLCIGTDMLMKLLESYCQNKGIKTPLRIGVVGFPNTGKSSVVNSLKHSKVCTVGSAPGITKSMQEIQLDNHMLLLDSPGVVMKEGSNISPNLTNCVTLKTMNDKKSRVEAILRRCNKEQVIMHYKISDYKDVSEFLSLLAGKMSKFKKGGIVNVNKAVRKVLYDLNSGGISYFTSPPQMQLTHVSATLLKEMGHEFNIESLESDELKLLQSLEPRSSKHMEVDSLGITKILMDDNEFKDEKITGSAEDEWEDMDDETGTEISDLQNVEEKTDTKLEHAGNEQNNKAEKMECEKSNKLAGSLSDALTRDFSFGEQKMAEDEDYDFNKDFV